MLEAVGDSWKEAAVVARSLARTDLAHSIPVDLLLILTGVLFAWLFWPVLAE